MIYFDDNPPGLTVFVIVSSYILYILFHIFYYWLLMLLLTAAIIRTTLGNAADRESLEGETNICLFIVYSRDCCLLTREWHLNSPSKWRGSASRNKREPRYGRAMVNISSQSSRCEGGLWLSPRQLSNWVKVATSITCDPYLNLIGLSIDCWRKHGGMSRRGSREDADSCISSSNVQTFIIWVLFWYAILAFVEETVLHRITDINWIIIIDKTSLCN